MSEQGRRQGRYRPLSISFVRVAAFPAGLYSEAFREADVEARLAAVLRDPVFAEALWVASPSLAAEAEMLLATPASAASKRRRASLHALARYVIRASTRATPFGAFAGVAAADWSEELACRLESPDRYVRKVRLDHVPALALARSLERDPAARLDLCVYVNPTAYRLGGRLTVAYRQPRDGGLGDQLSARVTAPLALVLDRAVEPVRYGDLLDDLAAAHPEAGAARLDGFLATLLGQEVLLSTARPPVDGADPLAHLRRELPGAAGEARRRVEELSAALDGYAATPLGAGLVALRTAYAAVDGGRPGELQGSLVVDLGLAAEATLPEALGPELDAALDVLARLGAAPHRPAALTAYAREFAERYGAREVPVLELLDPYGGLGPPAGYTNPASTRAAPAPERPREDRDRYLHRLVAEALAAGRVEVVLDPGEVAASVAFPDGTAPETLDVFVQLGREPDGGWTAVLPPAALGLPGGRACGRFAHLDPRLAALLAEAAAVERDGHPEATFAGVTYVHPSGHANNVAAAPHVDHYQIAIATTPGVPAERRLRLADVRVCLAGDGLALRAEGVPGRLVVRAPNLLNSRQAPNAVRFLLEASTRASSVGNWDWGGLAQMPFLPRVRVGRVVLTAARWLLPSGAPDEEELARWRERWSVPRFVHAGAFENRLLLDLDHPVHRELLRHEVGRGLVAVCEALPALEAAPARGPAGRHVLEAVVTMRVARPAPMAGVPESHPPVQGPRLVLPGRGWTYTKLYGPRPLHDQALRVLERALDGRDWFFVRYAEPLPQLRVRVRDERDPEALPALLEALVSCIDGGLVNRFGIEPYERETERYGGWAGLEICERVFCADSRLALAAPATGLDADLLAAARVEALLTGLGIDGDGRRATCAALVEGWTGEQETSGQLARRFQEQRAELRALLVGDHPALAAGHPFAVWRAAALDALAGPGEALRERAAAGRIDGGLERVLPSLVHMHANRAGLTRRDEHRVEWLLRRAHEDVRHLRRTVP